MAQAVTSPHGTAVPTALRSRPVPTQPDPAAAYPTAQQIALCQSTWASVTVADTPAATQHNIAAVGVAVFHNLFAAAPHVEALFKFRNPSGELSPVKLQRHAGVAFRAVDGVIANLSDPAATAAALAGVATGHFKYGVQEAHYGALLEAVVATLQQALGDGWTGEVAGAWGALAAAITAVVHGVYSERSEA